MTDYRGLVTEYVPRHLELCPRSVVVTTDVVQSFIDWLAVRDDAPLQQPTARLLVPLFRAELSEQWLVQHRLGRIKSDERASTPAGWTILPDGRGYRGWWGVRFK